MKPRVSLLTFGALTLCAATAVAQGGGEVLRQLRGDRPLPRALSCGPFLDYQQPLDEEGRHSSFLSDERSAFEASEATVAGQTIVPVPGDLIDGMRVWGLSIHNNLLSNCFDDDAVAFNIRAYTDMAGAPGAQVGPTLFSVPTRVDTGIQFLFAGLTIQQFDFALIPPIDNTSGTIAWIGAQRQLGDFDCLFHWIDETTPEFDDYAFWRAGVGAAPRGPDTLDVDLSICLSLAPIAVELESFEIE